MSNPLKQLVGQTAIYGFTTIAARLLNYFLVPIHTRVFNTAEFGTITELFAYVSFLNIFLTYGMETAFFKFFQNKEERNSVFSTSLISLGFTSILFLIITLLLSNTIANILNYSGKANYIIWFAFILSIDAVCAIPFARLRAENKVKRFAVIKTLNIFVNVGLNVYFFLAALRPQWYTESGILHNFSFMFYNGKIDVGYVFLSNLIASSVTFLLLLPNFIPKQLCFNVKIWKSMLIYALPLLFAGFAGIINETMDRILLKYLLPSNISLSEVGVYGACYKVSIMMTIFIQAFRFASEPFFFSRAKETDAKELYAKVMNYFIIACLLIFLVIMLHMDIVKLFVGKDFHAGLGVIPILLLANMFLGIYFNLSIWYKLTNKTKYGAYLAVIGAFITLILNIWWIPILGYVGSAWATFLCYLSMVVISYFIGQKHYPVKYNLKKIFIYFLSAISLFFISTLIPKFGKTSFLINWFILLMFVVLVFKLEKISFHQIKSLIKKPH